MVDLPSLVKRVPIKKNEKSTLPIVWEQTDAHHVAIWHSLVAPFITGDTSRADRRWNWNAIRLLEPFYKIRGNTPIYLTALVKISGKNLPIGMLMVLGTYPRIDGGEGLSTYTFYLSVAPDEFMKAHGLVEIPSIGRALIDSSIALSLGLKHKGRMWLHCAPKGKDLLFKYYKEKCDLLNFPKTRKLSVRKTNDGRYFYTTEERAIKLTKKFDPLRT